jgi:DNA-binding response OmpR family regulator
MYSLGANSYLVKPSDFDELVATVSGFQRFWSGAARLPKIP